MNLKRNTELEIYYLTTMAVIIQTWNNNRGYKKSLMNDYLYRLKYLLTQCILLITKGKIVILQWRKIDRHELNQMIKSNIISNGKLYHLIGYNETQYQFCNIPVKNA